jgi:hypothetical protein
MKSSYLILILLTTILSYSQKSTPTYREIVTNLFNQYDAYSINRIKDIQFEKRAIGWIVSTIDLQTKDTISELFWDNSKMKFNKISFPLNKDKISKNEIIDNFINTSQFNRYRSLAYYGYVGWDQDLIKLYENKKPLTDSELYSLGYAYSNYANSLLNYNFEFTSEKINFNLPISKNSMTDEQLITYLSIENKAIKAYLELYQRNPKFETIPGEIGIKYYNEIASNFLNLRIYQNEEIAMQQIQDKNLYSDNYKMYAKNMLDSCDKDALLFTVGDNDTFPLLTYQAQNNYRTDVLIVNTSLLQSPQYILMMKEGILDSGGIPLSISSDFIKDRLSEVIANLNSIVTNKFNIAENFTNSYQVIPSSNFVFQENKTVLKWNIDEPIIYRNQLVLLDIIATNNWKRPIYFSINNSYENYLGLSNYLQFEGVVYKLVSNKGEVSKSEIGFITPSKLELNLNRFQFNNKANLPVEERQLIMDYRLIYNRLASYYIKKNDTKKATLILDECIKLFPNDKAYFSFDIVSIIENYYKLASFEKGKALQTQLFQNFKNGFDNYSFLTENDRKAKYERTKEYLDFLNENYKIE